MKITYIFLIFSLIFLETSVLHAQLPQQTQADAGQDSSAETCGHLRQGRDLAACLCADAVKALNMDDFRKSVAQAIPRNSSGRLIIRLWLNEKGLYACHDILKNTLDSSLLGTLEPQLRSLVYSKPALPCWLTIPFNIRAPDSLSLPPTLRVSSPELSDIPAGMVFEVKSKELLLSGRAFASAGLKAVYVQRQLQIMGTNGSFQTSLPLKEGENVISISAEDRQGRITVLKFTVNH